MKAKGKQIMCFTKKRDGTNSLCLLATKVMGSVEVDPPGWEHE